MYQNENENKHKEEACDSISSRNELTPNNFSSRGDETKFTDIYLKINIDNSVIYIDRNHVCNDKHKTHLNYRSLGYNSKRGIHGPIRIFFDANDFKIKRAFKFRVGYVGFREP